MLMYLRSFWQQALELTGKMVEDYVEAQKSVIEYYIHLQSRLYENADWVF